VRNALLLMRTKHGAISSENSETTVARTSRAGCVIDESYLTNDEPSQAASRW
jgi:hypothetical protein